MFRGEARVDVRLSPTDVPILAGWARLLMMLQTVISLLIVIILAVRAVNIL